MTQIEVLQIISAMPPLELTSKRWAEMYYIKRENLGEAERAMDPGVDSKEKAIEWLTNQ